MDMKVIKDALSNDLARHLAPVPLSGLDVTEGMDHEGDPVVRLRVIYDEGRGTPTGVQMFEAFGIVRDRLEGMGETRFPLLTFISLSDRNAEAA